MLKFENPTNGRFYYVEIKKDMLDDTVLAITYGGYFHSRHRNIMCDSYPAICAEIKRIAKRRIAHGYVLVI
jgi:hypothetical protein